ncbi:MAG TPA: hypothetical protein VI603_14530 [Saprospiraceae bacterium]|nr:hypothetical protein [Saprospiraceae bacterium]
MTGGNAHTFYIRLSNEGIALNPDLILPLSRTNLPYTSMRFREKEELYWQVSIQQYKGEQGLLIIDVVDYIPEDVTSFYTQKPQSPIGVLEFSRIRWSELLPHLSSYKKAAFDHLLEPEAPAHQMTPPIVQRTEGWRYAQDNRQIQVTFHVPFHNATFVTGGVLVTHRVDSHDVELLIANGFILREFGLLKEYFAKALHKKQFTVTATIKIEEGKVIDASATSPDIAKIDERFLDAVRYLEAKSIQQMPPPDIAKEFFSAEEMYGREEQEENTQNGLRLLEIILRDEHIRNRQQIQYLAGKMHLHQHKILFTAHPQFGFVFQLMGQLHMHFVWELLNSHATYLWTYDPHTIPHNLALRKLEYVLSAIRTQGRQVYRFGIADDIGVSDLHFHVIRHDKVSSSVVDSFPVWRMRLHEILI